MVYGMTPKQCNNPECQKEFVWHTLPLEDMLKQMDVELSTKWIFNHQEKMVLAKRMVKGSLTRDSSSIDGKENAGDLSLLTPEEQQVIQVAYSLYFHDLLSSTVEVVFKMVTLETSWSVYFLTKILCGLSRADQYRQETRRI